MPFKSGDLVVLKSGGPTMTVILVEGDKLNCGWFGPGGEYHWSTFVDDSLSAVEADGTLRGISVHDSLEIGEWLNTDQGEKMVMNVLKRNGYGR